jgi:hypothetical protein
VPGDISARQLRFIIAGKRNESPSNRQSQYYHHRHKDSSHMTTSRSAGGAPAICALSHYSSHAIQNRTKSSEPSGRRSSCQAPGEAGDRVSTLRRVPAEIHPDNLGSNVPAHPRAVFITDIAPAEPETSRPFLLHLVYHYLDLLLYMPSATSCLLVAWPA